jgi:pimeloyl-ACP methyl ester carboxylesterase
MSALIVNNEIVHYEAIGRGKPIIFLHGWLGSWRYWIPSMQEASSAYRAYAIDMWGFGDTAKVNERYDIREQVNLLNHFLYEMGIGKIALVGHDFGAMIALRYAQMFPDLVDRIMIIGYPMGESLISEKVGTQSLPELQSWMLNGIQDAEPARKEAEKADIAAISASLSTMSEMNLADLVIKLDMPCLIVHGEMDKAVSAPPSETITQLNENAHHLLFESAGHFPMIEEPSKFARLLKEFLALETGESPRKLQLKEEWKRRFR